MVIVMSIDINPIECKQCGAQLPICKNEEFLTCEYCGSIISNPFYDDPHKAAAVNTSMPTPTSKPMPTPQQCLYRLKSCGTTIFTPKTFCVFRTYALLTDDRSGTVSERIDFCDVISYKISMSSNVVFNMINSRKVVIKCLYTNKAAELMSLISSLMRRL